MRSSKFSSSFQISGSKILIDPGHIGGEFSEMEGRHFAIGDDEPVKEGDLALSVALKLKSELQKKERSYLFRGNKINRLLKSVPKILKNLLRLGSVEWNGFKTASEERSKKNSKKTGTLFLQGE